MGCQSQDATDAKPGNRQGAGFEVQPCPDAAARPGISGSPLSWPRSSSEQWRRWQTSVYHTLLSVGGRILDQFKCFSLFQRQPSWKCYILRSWWSLKDYFNPSLGHVGETLTVKSAPATQFWSCVNSDVGAECSQPWSDSAELWMWG